MTNSHGNIRLAYDASAYRVTLLPKVAPFLDHGGDLLRELIVLNRQSAASHHGNSNDGDARLVDKQHDTLATVFDQIASN